MWLKILFAVVAMTLAGSLGAQNVVEPDDRWEVLTEEALRGNEDYFLFLFNNGKPASVPDRGLLERSRPFVLTVVKFTDGTMRLVYSDVSSQSGRSWTPHLYCVRGLYSVIEPFPITPRAWRTKLYKAPRLVRESNGVIRMFPYNTEQLLLGHDVATVCVESKKEVTIAFRNSFLISLEINAIIRGWLKEKWDEAARRAQNP